MLVHITPALPPAISGVGDYASLLALALREKHGIESVFYLGADPGAAKLDRFLEEQAGTVLLQYSGYGYAAKGCPFGLVRTLERWRAKNPSRRLITIFHEISARGRPWQSSFWLRPFQRALAARLARASSALLTSRGGSKRELSELLGPQAPAIHVLPIFSNVGEPPVLIPFSERQDMLIVFGTAGRRREVYKNGTDLLEQTCRNLGLTRIVDIGTNCGNIPESVGGIPVRACGEISATQIHVYLQRAKAGILDYPEDILGKSGIFAAYAAHGLASVVNGSEIAPDDGLQRGLHFFHNAPPENLARAEQAGKAAFAWYRGHDAAKHAAWVAAAVRK